MRLKPVGWAGIVAPAMQEQCPGWEDGRKEMGLLTLILFPVCKPNYSVEFSKVLCWMSWVLTQGLSQSVRKKDEIRPFTRFPWRFILHGLEVLQNRLI